MKKYLIVLLVSTFVLFSFENISAQDQSKINKDYDAELAKRLGADKYGMRNYVFVLLKTGDKKVEDEKERAKIFEGHFANMNRLAEEGKLVVAGPFDGVEGWRGMFIFNVKTVEEAKKLTETDPVIVSGIMKAEYHTYYGSAALIDVNKVHKKLAETNF